MFINIDIIMNNINKPNFSPEFIDTKNISPNLDSDDYLKLMNLNFSDFEWKKVASIWWWFWILEMDLATRWTEVEIIDPIYSNEKLIQKKWQETYDWVYQSYINSLRHKNSFLENWIDDMKKRIWQLLKDGKNNSYELSKIEEELAEKLQLKERKDKLLKNKLLIKQNMERWKEKKSNNLKLNPSSWENIKGIESNSKDFVFINHILNYLPDKISTFLKQADKILKDWWTIFIVDYTDEVPNLQKFFKKHWTYNILWWTFCGSLKKWEFKNLWK